MKEMEIFLLQEFPTERILTTKAHILHILNNISFKVRSINFVCDEIHDRNVIC